jgi:hypothetical protein
MGNERSESRLVGDESSTDGGLGRLFFDGLPAMAGIVTVITQPFAQDSMRAMFWLPDWLPIVVAVTVSGLLAVYKVRFVRGSSPGECAICVPVLMLIIFSAYATGNNVVYYMKEGYSRAATPSGASSEELTTLQRERDILHQQLQSAQELIATLRRALGLPEPSEATPHSSLPSLLGALPGIAAARAHAQEPSRSTPDRPRGEAPRADKLDVKRLEEALKRYEAQQQQLNRNLKAIQKEPAQPSPPPLIKSW